MVRRNSALLCETHRLRENPQGRSRAVTDTDEDMDRILIMATLKLQARLDEITTKRDGTKKDVSDRDTRMKRGGLCQRS